jgi:hypothetical protein
MSDEVIRSQLPNENYRKGWDETFGKKDETFGKKDETFGKKDEDVVAPGWGPDSWCKRCQCSHVPKEAHLVHGND